MPTSSYDTERPTFTPPSSERPGRPDRGDEISLLHLVSSALRHHRLLLGLPLLSSVLVLAVALALPRSYRTTVSFLPVTANVSASQLSGLAAQFGLSISAEDGGQSPQFYANLATTPDLLRQVAETHFRFFDARDTLQGTFIQLYELEEDSYGNTLDGAMRLLREEIIAAQPNRQTGVVEITVDTRWPALSQQIAAFVVDYINAFNLRRRQCQRYPHRIADSRAAGPELQHHALDRPPQYPHLLLGF